MDLKYIGIFCKERVVGQKKGGCWLQIAVGCSAQVQINVKCLGGSPGWWLLAGGCSSQVVPGAGWTVLVLHKEVTVSVSVDQRNSESTAQPPAFTGTSQLVSFVSSQELAAMKVKWDKRFARFKALLSVGGMTILTLVRMKTKIDC